MIQVSMGMVKWTNGARGGAGGTYDIGEETESAEGVDGCLGGLGFLLAVHVGDEGDVDKSEVIVTDAELELTHGFYEGRGFDVADCASELHNAC